MKQIQRSQSGSALMMALACAVIIAGLGGAAFMYVQSRLRSVHQAASWDQALVTAESGVEIALEEIRKTIHDPAKAWVGWIPNAALPAADPLPGEVAPAVAQSYSLVAPELTHNDDGTPRSWFQITVDAPAFLKAPSGEQWYRIRSLGAADIPGGRVVTGDKLDNDLRKYSLVSDRHTGKRVAGPQSTRFIEAIAKPVGAFRLALMAAEDIDFNDRAVVVDSYDSRDPNKSTNGAFDPAKRQNHGDVATNGQVINEASAQIYGNLMTASSSKLYSANGATEVAEAFYQAIPGISRPILLPDPGTPALITAAGTITALPNKPALYQLSALTLSGNSDVLRIQGAADGSPTFIQILVTGDLRISGNQAAIQLDPGVYARIFVAGDADLGGRGIRNLGPPAHLQIYGIDPPAAENRAVRISSSTAFNGAVYAPAFQLRLGTGGNTGALSGSFVGKRISVNGAPAIHHDQALASAGMITDYKIASWFEDER